jgi:hypothetical protein
MARAYAIDVDDDLGVKVYQIKNLEGTKPRTIGDYKKIKQWYQDRRK